MEGLGRTRGVENSANEYDVVCTSISVSHRSFVYMQSVRATKKCVYRRGGVVYKRDEAKKNVAGYCNIAIRRDEALANMFRLKNKHRIHNKRAR